jgi:hypothetical protein
MSKAPQKIDKGSEKGTDFIFKLSGIELPADVKDRIAGEIRATVMRELAKTDMGARKTGSSTGKAGAPVGGIKATSAIFVPIGWDGGWWVLGGPIVMRDVVARFDKVRFEAREVGF